MLELSTKPEVTRCFCDSDAVPKMSAMELRWRDGTGTAERVWHLPQGVSVVSPAPTRFGIAVERIGDDAFKVQLRWNHVYFAWNPVRGMEIMSSSLSLILKALGTDLWDLLYQPVDGSLAA